MKATSVFDGQPAFTFVSFIPNIEKTQLEPVV